MGDTADQVIAPIWKIYPATSHAEQYILNSRHCGNLLWQSSLTLLSPTYSPGSDPRCPDAEGFANVAAEHTSAANTTAAASAAHVTRDAFDFTSYPFLSLAFCRFRPRISVQSPVTPRIISNFPAHGKGPLLGKGVPSLGKVAGEAAEAIYSAVMRTGSAIVTARHIRLL